MEDRDAKEAEAKRLEHMSFQQIKEDEENKYYNRRIENDGWSQQQVNDEKQRQKIREKENQQHYW
jgi:hypothetical protein